MSKDAANTAQSPMNAYRPDSGRRSMLGMSGAIAAGLGAYALARTTDGHATTPSTPAFVNVQDYNAVGDGITDDTLAITTALNAAAGKSITVFPATSNSYLTTGLTVPANSNIILLGTIKLRATATPNVLRLGNNTSVVGPGTLDCSNLAASCGLYVFGATNIYVRDITSTNAGYWPVTISGCSNVTLENCTFSNSVASAQFAAGSTRCWAIGCKIFGIQDEGFAFYGGVTDSGIVNSTVYNNGYSGIEVLNDGASTAAMVPCERILIRDNICYGNGGGGIATDTGPGGTTSRHLDISIIGNCIHHNAKSTGENAGVVLRYVNRVQFCNNQIFNDGANTTPTYGLYVWINVWRATISGNDIHNSGQGGVSGVGIYVFMGAHNILINGNQIYDDQTTRTMAYALGGTATSGVRAMNNLWGPTINANPVAPALLGGSNVFANNQIGTP